MAGMTVLANFAVRTGFFRVARAAREFGMLARQREACLGVVIELPRAPAGRVVTAVAFITE